MQTGIEGLLGRLANRDLILPFFESFIISDQWPDSYTIEVDSSPYYGLNDGYFHPSSMPLLDARQLYFLVHPDTKDKMIPQRRSLQSQMTLSMGSALHAVLQTQMEIAGIITKDQTEVEYVNTEHNVRGRIDWIANLPNGLTTVVELKTQNSYGFKNQKDVKDSWRAQLNLALDSQDCDLGVLLVLESGWPYSMKEFHVKRDCNILNEIYNKFDYVMECVKRNEPPRHCCVLGSRQMNDCPARGECWLKEGV